MIIYSPVKKAPYPINSIAELKLQIGRQGQFFGEDKSGPACNFRSYYPCDKTLYQALGMAGHNGLDIPLYTGTEVYASHNGIIVETSSDPNAGLGVVIFDKTQLIKTYYWHLESFPVKVGDEVNAGQVIGYADNTGLSSGSHLHFGLKETDQYGISIKTNSFNGAIDPLPYMVWFNTMDKELLIKARQICEGYLDPAGQTYWADKEEKPYWVARIKDKIRQLQEVLTELEK